MRKPLICIVHRIPYPPNKGDKIRSYNLISRLAQDHDVYLGAFIDDKADHEHVDKVASLCRESRFVTITPWVRTLTSCVGLLTGEPLSVRYYRCRAMAAWVREKLAQHPDARVYVYSSAMGQFVPADRLPGTVVDFVDVDSDKWEQYSKSKVFPMNWVYAREAKTLLKHDVNLATGAAASTFVSTKEADFFTTLASGLKGKIHAVNNGVDTSFFDPQIDAHQAPIASTPMICFVGAMDYWANVEGIQWFVKEVLPAILTQEPAFKLYIVGSNPGDAVLRLANDHIVVTGRVEDVRPYVRAASVVIAPLRIARGIQNKVLEAMSMAKPVVATSMAMEGIAPDHVRVADTAEAFAASVLALYRQQDDAKLLGAQARSYVEAEFTWSAALDKLAPMLNA